MKIENVIEWVNGKKDNPTPLSAQNLNRVNIGTETALNDLESQLTDKINTNVTTLESKIKTLTSSANDGYAKAEETEKMLGGYSLRVVETSPASPGENTIYFITEA